MLIMKNNKIWIKYFQITSEYLFLFVIKYINLIFNKFIHHNHTTTEILLN
jgi:hypothetical protein